MRRWYRATQSFLNATPKICDCACSTLRGGGAKYRPEAAAVAFVSHQHAPRPGVLVPQSFGVHKQKRVPFCSARATILVSLSRKGPTHILCHVILPPTYVREGTWKISLGDVNCSRVQGGIILRKAAKNYTLSALMPFAGALCPNHREPLTGGLPNLSRQVRVVYVCGGQTNREGSFTNVPKGGESAL